MAGRGRRNTRQEAPQGQDEEWGGAESDAQRQEREEAERAAREADQEEAEEGEDDGEGDGDFEAGDAPDEDAEADLAAVSRVDHDAGGPEAAFVDETSGDGLAVGTVLTPRQQVGIDPEDPFRAAEQASDRSGLTNAQTDHERQNVLDPVSGTANPGVTAAHRHSAPGTLGASDMSGGLPKADPLAGAGPQIREVLSKLGAASRKALNEGKRGQGYLSLRDLGTNKAVMDTLVAGGHVTQEQRPGAHFHPETGTVYRLASHQEPA